MPEKYENSKKQATQSRHSGKCKKTMAKRKEASQTG